MSQNSSQGIPCHPPSFKDSEPTVHSFTLELELQQWRVLLNKTHLEQKFKGDERKIPHPLKNKADVFQFQLRKAPLSSSNPYRDINHNRPSCKSFLSAVRRGSAVMLQSEQGKKLDPKHDEQIGPKRPRSTKCDEAVNASNSSVCVILRLLSSRQLRTQILGDTWAQNYELTSYFKAGVDLKRLLWVIAAQYVGGFKVFGSEFVSKDGMTSVAVGLPLELNVYPPAVMSHRWFINVICHFLQKSPPFYGNYCSESMLVAVYSRACWVLNEALSYFALFNSVWNWASLWSPPTIPEPYKTRDKQRAFKARLRPLKHDQD